MIAYRILSVAWSCYTARFELGEKMKVKLDEEGREGKTYWTWMESATQKASLCLTRTVRAGTLLLPP